MTSVDPDLLRPERAPTPGRIGKWARTASGRIVFPRDPRPEDIVVEDVAHHLSLICRFGGAVRTLYVVGEHAVRVSRVVEMLGGTKAEQFHGLHHDDSEYVLGDWIWPLKHSEEMEAARGLEKRWEDAIAERFGLAKEMPAIVKHADLVLLATEKRDLTRSPGGDITPEALAATEKLGTKWRTDAHAPLPERIDPWTPEVARAAFLASHVELGGRVLVCATAIADGDVTLVRHAEVPAAPIPMILHCPGVGEDGTVCGARHIDRNEFASRPHKSHSCQRCGFTFSPAAVPTVGVQFLPGYKDGEVKT